MLVPSFRFVVFVVEDPTSKLAKAPRPFSLGKFCPKTACLTGRNCRSWYKNIQYSFKKNKKKASPKTLKRNLWLKVFFGVILIWFHVATFLTTPPIRKQNQKRWAPKWMILLHEPPIWRQRSYGSTVFHQTYRDFPSQRVVFLPCWCFQRHLRPKCKKNLERGKQLSTKGCWKINLGNVARQTKKTSSLYAYLMEKLDVAFATCDG